jgi:hypothetical protein
VGSEEHRESIEGATMKIGKPLRVYRVEPVKDPVPRKQEPAAKPSRRRRAEPKPLAPK